MPGVGGVDGARAAYAAQEWGRAHQLYATAGPLDADDQDRYAICAMLLGRMDEYFQLREQAHDDLLARGDLVGAAQAAYWAGMQRVVMGDAAVGSGWLARAARLVAEDGTDSVPAGFMQIASSFEAVGSGDLDGALALVASAIDTGRRLASADLVALALYHRGYVLIRSGRTDEGLAALDEAMVEITAGHASPMVTGIVYCGVVDGCWAAYELHRAQEWTTLMSTWCDAQPDLANFTGECKVRRAELKQLHGEWGDAETELAGVSSADVDAWAAGMAAYLSGNLDRLQGRYDDAERSFAEASRLGEDPQPGLALLRLAKGSVQAAAAMIRRCLAETQDDAKRVEVLVAAVEVLIAAADLDAARDAQAQLGALARSRRTATLDALHAQSRALLEAASGRPDAALPAARDALKYWVKLRTPYQEARTRLVIAEACRALGDGESADRETTTARALLESLGAVPDLARLTLSSGLLSTREVEVLRLLTTGATNRAIADQLVLSERTIDRHVSNIYAKLGVSSRAAATTYAFENQLV